MRLEDLLNFAFELALRDETDAVERGRGRNIFAATESVGTRLSS